jgi:hypothetical protein
MAKLHVMEEFDALSLLQNTIRFDFFGTLFLSFCAEMFIWNYMLIYNEYYVLHIIDYVAI